MACGDGRGVDSVPGGGLTKYSVARTARQDGLVGSSEHHLSKRGFRPDHSAHCSKVEVFSALAIVATAGAVTERLNVFDTVVVTIRSPSNVLQDAVRVKIKLDFVY